MTKNSNYVKKETLYIGVGIALLIGILIGIVINAGQKTEFTQQTGRQVNQGQPMPPPDMSSQQAQLIISLEQQVAGNPEDVEAWTRLGHIYYDLNQFNKAINAYNRSLQLRPGNPDVITDLGVMYRRAGRPEEAVAAFNQAISIDPGHQQSRFNKGVVLLNDLHDAQGAIAAWEELLRLNPAAQTPNGIPVRQLLDGIKIPKGN